MRGTLRWLGLVSVGVVLVSPLSAHAQSQKKKITRDQLVGTWVDVLINPGLFRRDTLQIVRELFLTLQADSTWHYRMLENGVEQPPNTWFRSDGALGLDNDPPAPNEKRRWRWAADKLWLDGEIWQVVLRGQRLILGPMDAYQNDDQFVCWSSQQGLLKRNAYPIFNLKRVDPSKPVPAPTTLPPSTPPTIKRADLVGTWEAGADGPSGLKRLVLRPDSTWSGVTGSGSSVPAGIGLPANSRWYILPGDTLWLTQLPVVNGQFTKDGKTTFTYLVTKIKLANKGKEQSLFLDSCDGAPWDFTKRAP